MPKVLRISECLTGADFENTILNILVNLGFDAHLTGKEDRGIDIIASKTVDEKAYKFYIQCKFWNTTVGMKPIQEAFTGCHYFGNDGTPVVITNNRVTIEARQYARKLGVEVIGKAEGGKCDVGITGLQGLLIGSMCRNEEQLRASVKGSIEEQKLDTTEELKRAVIDDLDKVDELQKEAARLQHEALKIYKKVVLKNIDYG